MTETTTRVRGMRSALRRKASRGQDGEAAWKWRRSFSAELSEISDVEAKTPWHALANRVVFTCRGRTYTVGDMLLQDEANEIAHELKHSIGLHRSSGS